MFSFHADASKAALAVLVYRLEKWGYSFIDCQVPTKHLKSLGAKEITREMFLQRLYSEDSTTPYYNWQIE